MLLTYTMKRICLEGDMAGHSRTWVVKCVAKGTSLLATKLFCFMLPVGLSGGPLNSAVRLNAVSVSRTITS